MCARQCSDSDNVDLNWVPLEERKQEAKGLASQNLHPLISLHWQSKSNRKKLHCQVLTLTVRKKERKNGSQEVKEITHEKVKNFVFQIKRKWSATTQFRAAVKTKDAIFIFSKSFANLIFIFEFIVLLILKIFDLF